MHCSLSSAYFDTRMNCSSLISSLVEEQLNSGNQLDRLSEVRNGANHFDCDEEILFRSFFFPSQLHLEFDFRREWRKSSEDWRRSNQPSRKRNCVERDDRYSSRPDAPYSNYGSSHSSRWEISLAVAPSDWNRLE
ncbi:hypothetical protein PMAYCL1PPCAC_07342, partial [Pristionchus mayeri]